MTENLSTKDFGETSNQNNVVNPNSDPKLTSSLDGSKASNDIYESQETGIWWWCIIHNNLTKRNLDFVYPTSTIYFTYKDLVDELIDVTQQYFAEEVPTATLLKLPETQRLILLTQGNLPTNKFIANVLALVDGTFETEEVNITVPTGNIYSICSFRRILDPEYEYLAFKEEIDNVQITDLKNDLMASLVVFDKNNVTGSNINQRLADVELQLDQLIAIKDRLIRLNVLVADLTAIPKINAKIAELEESRQKLLQFKEKYDSFSR